MIESVTIEADDVLKRLEWLYFSNLKVQKDTAKLVRAALSEARKEVVAGAKTAMNADPRAAYKAVRTAVYKKIIGGQVNILNKRKGTAQVREWNPQRSLVEGQWGGNRRPRSARTEQLNGYYGTDRAFILRFLNQGTTERMTKYGSRGQISGRHWFGPASTRGINKAAAKLHELIERAINEVWND